VFFHLSCRKCLTYLDYHWCEVWYKPGGAGCGTDLAEIGDNSGDQTTPIPGTCYGDQEHFGSR